jgi:hypothetical protein
VFLTLIIDKKAVSMGAVIIMRKQYFISASEKITKVVLPKHNEEPGFSIMVGRKSLLNPKKVRGRPRMTSRIFDTGVFKHVIVVNIEIDLNISQHVLNLSHPRKLRH